VSDKSIYDLLKEMNGDQIKEEANYQDEKYSELLEELRSWLSNNYSNELLRLLDNENTKDNIRDLIRVFLNEVEIDYYNYEFENLVNKLFDDLVGFAFLENYIYDDRIEEINGNSWCDIEIVSNNGWYKLKEKFASKRHAINIIRKMMRLGGVILDEKQPIGDSYISSGTRISAIISPIIDEDVGVTFSIRKQKAKIFTLEELVELNTCTKDEFRLLQTCLQHGISIGIAGSTSSGKTSDIASLISTMAHEKRIFVIEDTRETFVDSLDKRVIFVKTRDSDEKDRDVSASNLLKTALRYHPDIIVPAEIRDQAALTAVEAGRTGHAILTGLHANSAIEAYDRILSMCMMGKRDISEDLLMKFILSAFPIMVFKAQLPDYSRKYMEVFEVLGYEKSSKKIYGNTLYRYIVKDTLFDSDGKIAKVEGEHIRVNPISHSLANKLLRNGCSKETIDFFAGDGWDEYEH